jgi:hypothetical protein
VVSDRLSFVAITAATITPDGRTNTATWQAPASFPAEFVYFGATQQEIVAYSGLLDFISA